MNDITLGFILFLCGVAIATTYFIRSNKADKANRDALRDELQMQKAKLTNYETKLESLHAWIQMLDREKSAFKHVEIKDKVDKLEKDLIDLQKQVSRLRPITKVILPEELIKQAANWSDISRISRKKRKAGVSQ